MRLPSAIVALSSILLAATPVRTEEARYITLKNSSWDTGARVEVKRGKAQACIDNTNVGSKDLARGQSWSVPCEGQEVCWRRLVLGYADETWTDWNRDSCFDSAEHDL